MSDKMTTLKDEITGDNVYPNIKNDNIESKSITSDKLVEEYATTESVSNDIATAYTNSVHNSYPTHNKDLYATIDYQDVEIRAHQDKDGGEGFVNIIGETSVEISTNDTQITINDGNIFTNESYEPTTARSLTTKAYVDSHSGGGSSELPYVTLVGTNRSTTGHMLISFRTSKALNSMTELCEYLIDNGYVYTSAVDNIIADFKSQFTLTNPDDISTALYYSGARAGCCKTLSVTGVSKPPGSSANFTPVSIYYAYAGTHGGTGELLAEDGIYAIQVYSGSTGYGARTSQIYNDTGWSEYVIKSYEV